MSSCRAFSKICSATISINRLPRYSESIAVQNRAHYEAIERPDYMQQWHPFIQRYTYHNQQDTFYLRYYESEAQDLIDPDTALPVVDFMNQPVKYTDIGYRLMRLDTAGVAHQMPLLPAQKDLRVGMQMLSLADRLNYGIVTSHLFPN